jgi:ligand-binding SRPBCC domain-containing protein
MKLYRLQHTQFLSIQLHDAWRFFSDPYNLQRITPPWLDFSITSEISEKMYAGMIIIYRIKIMFGLPTNWITEITHVQEPIFFVDEQRFGPYRFWHYQHIFKETVKGIEMQDIVHYALPFGIIGQLINQLLIQNKINEIFNFRRQALDQIFNNLATSQKQRDKSTEVQSRKIIER